MDKIKNKIKKEIDEIYNMNVLHIIDNFIANITKNK